MIRYPEALTKIEEAVTQESPTWLTRAATRTALFAALPGYTEEVKNTRGRTQKLSPFWGDVKLVYMRRQHNKCIYCETKLEGREFATVQWDLEHFRPKSNVRKWERSSYSFSTGDALPAGYFLLAYHLHNYAVACKTCNSPFKSDYFPVAAARIADRPTPQDYVAEDALLIYPLGTTDEDPEDLLTFDGATAIPKYVEAQDAHKWRRGQVMIDFFGLNRDGLLYNRASWLLRTVWPNAQLAAQGDAEAIDNVAWLHSEQAPYTSCTRCFIMVCNVAFHDAQQMLSAFKKIVRDMEEN